MDSRWAASRCTTSPLPFQPCPSSLDASQAGAEAAFVADQASKLSWNDSPMNLTNIPASRRVQNGPELEVVAPCKFLLLLLHAPDLAWMAWHPQPRTCMYACYDHEKGVHLVDARADVIVKSWTADELMGRSCGPRGNTCTRGQGECDRKLSNGLAWSHDGCRPAVLLDQPCVVLEFEAKCTYALT